MSTMPKTSLDAEPRFQELAESWVAATYLLSWSRAGTKLPEFQEIVSMGEAAIPLVLRRMGKDTGDWLLVLAQITGENPIQPADRGEIDGIEAAWFRWARERGYVW